MQVFWSARKKIFFLKENSANLADFEFSAKESVKNTERKKTVMLSGFSVVKLNRPILWFYVSVIYCRIKSFL